MGDSILDWEKICKQIERERDQLFERNCVLERVLKVSEILDLEKQRDLWKQEALAARELADGTERASCGCNSFEISKDLIRKHEAARKATTEAG